MVLLISAFNLLRSSISIEELNEVTNRKQLGEVA